MSAIKRLFAKGSFLGIRFGVVILLSLVLMFYDHRTVGSSLLRNSLTVVVLPVRYLVDWPVEVVRYIENAASTRETLIRDNEKLRAKQLFLQSKVQQLLSLKQENAHLRALLSSSSRIQGDVVVAQLLAVGLNTLSQQVLIDQGTSAKVYVGQPVLDAYGVMGQVIEANVGTSRIMLVTDTRSAVPAQVARNGLRVIAVGDGDSGKLRLMHVPDTADVRVGDVLLTSGLGLRFPSGYPVGTVLQVRHHAGARFAEITVLPLAHVNRSRQVLLVWPRATTTQGGH